MIVVPAIHNLDNETAPEQKGWGWHRVSELVETANYYLLLRGGQLVTPANLYTRYGYLNELPDSLGVGVTALPTRKGLHGDQFCEFITPNIDLTKIEFVPAGWGCKVLKVIKYSSFVY